MQIPERLLDDFRVIVGMGSIILDNAVVEDECLIGAGTLITENKRIPSRSLVFGSPGKVIRTLSEDELRFLKQSADGYVQLAQELCRQIAK